MSHTDDLRLFRGQIKPRLRTIAVSPNTIASLLLGLLIPWIAQFTPGGQLSISNLVNIGFTFASLSIGVCTSALILTFALPGEARLKKWSQLEGETSKFSALSDLIFVCAWSALAQMAVICVCILATLFGGDLPVAPPHMTLTHQTALSLATAVFIYALGQLVLIVQTLVQVGVVVIAEETE